MFVPVRFSRVVTLVVVWIFTLLSESTLYFRLMSLLFLFCRQCIASSTEDKLEGCSETWWEGNWTLVAKNPLGQHVLTDAAELSHRGGCFTLDLSTTSGRKSAWR